MADRFFSCCERLLAPATAAQNRRQSVERAGEIWRKGVWTGVGLIAIEADGFLGRCQRVPLLPRSFRIIAKLLSEPARPGSNTSGLALVWAR